jgi:outer membrane protein insertion porin family
MLKRPYTMLLAVAIILIASIPSPAQQPEQSSNAPTINEITLEGLVRTNKIVRFNIKNKIGLPYSAKTNKDDVKRLMATGQFENVTISVIASDDGVSLIYRFQEKPLIKDIRITGNEHIKTKKIRKKISLEKGDFFDAIKFNRELDDVREMYREKNYKSIRIDYESLLDPRTNSVDIEVRVAEGEKPKIKKIKITGNDSIKASKIRKAMTSKKRGYFSWITGKGIYDADQLDLDHENIKSLYLSRGYLDVKVKGPEPLFSKNRKKVTLNIEVIEGKSYSVGSVQFVGNKILTTEELHRACGLKSGDTFRKGVEMNLNSVDMSTFLIRTKYASKGYIDANISVIALPGEDPYQFDLTFNIKENEQVKIRKIDITGNHITQDKVIRRELAVDPGNIYNNTRIRNSISRLRNLGYFKIVDIYPRPTPEQNQRDLVVRVEEGETVRLGAGMAFSSVDQLVGSLELSFSNFDITNFGSFRGGGQKFRMLTKFGSKRRDYEINFTEPWFLNRRLSAGFDVYQHDLRFLSSDYDKKTTGFDVRFSKMLLKRIRGKLTYKYETIKIDADSNAAPSILAEPDKSTVSSIKTDFIRDTRNNILFATDGARTSASYEVAGLGGTRYWFRQNYRHTMYVPSFFNTTLKLRGWLGFITPYGDTDELTISERFFLGGRTTIRGFKYRHVGPKDDVGDEYIGGQSLVLFSAEYVIPIVENINWAFFYDMGNVYADQYDIDLSDMRSGYGIGVRLLLPALRIPISFDYAWPLDNGDEDDKPRFEFSIGTTY